MTIDVIICARVKKETSKGFFLSRFAFFVFLLKDNRQIEREIFNDRVVGRLQHLLIIEASIEFLSDIAYETDCNSIVGEREKKKKQLSHLWRMIGIIVLCI